MSYGMHDYLADKAQQRYTYMQKKAAAKKPWEADPDPGEPTNTEIDKEHWAEVNKKRGVKEPSWLQSRMADARDVYALGKAKAGEYYSRARAFVAKHPEILYGLGGAGIGAGVGALVSPKRRLLGSLIGLGLGGVIGYGGKWAWDKYNVGDKLAGAKREVGNKLDMAGQDLKQKYNKIRYGEQFQGMNPKEYGEHIKSLAQAGLLQR